MDLVLLHDCPFYRDADGRVYARRGNYYYQLYRDNYLQVFDRIRILAKVADTAPEVRQPQPADGPEVEILSAGNWRGPLAFARNYSAFRRQLTEQLSGRCAVIMIAPGHIGGMARGLLTGRGFPFGVEVISDAYDAFAPGTRTGPLRPVYRWWLTRQVRRQCRDACAVRYVSSYSIPDRYPASPGAYTTHYSSIELVPEALASAARPVRPDLREPVLVFVGTLDHGTKGADLLIDAVGQCVAGGLPLRLIAVGGGASRDRLAAQAATWGIADRVEFTGQLPFGEAVRAQLDRADAFVLPSRHEGLPRAMIEAASRALPCICTRVGGVLEFLPPEDTVPPNDAGALARKIREVVTDPQRMAAMSARNLSKAHEYRADALRARRREFYTHVVRKTEEWFERHG